MHQLEAVENMILDQPEASPEATWLTRFAENGDEAAFAALVRSYGPLIFGLCQRVLQHQQDAEDAFQATFLVLARKASSISNRECVGSWLYSVAQRIAQQAKAKRARLPVQEATPTDVPAPDETAELLWRDLRPILDDEVSRLPLKYRQAFLLCYFEGRTNEQAAAQLGCPVGTILSRLHRARERLRGQLKRRGLALSASLLLVLIAERARAVPPPPLTQTTVQAAMLFHEAEALATAALPTNVAALAEGCLQSFRRIRRQTRAAGWLALGVGLGLVVLLIVALGREKSDEEKLQGAWQATRVQFGDLALQDFGSTMTFTGERWDLDCKLFPNAEFKESATFRINADASPKTIDYYPRPGVRYPGVYQLDGNTLKLRFSINGVRPANLDGPLAANTFHYELRQQ